MTFITQAKKQQIDSEVNRLMNHFISVPVEDREKVLKQFVSIAEKSLKK